jgi:nucleic acid/nucleotide deaminase of polymorphic system toxin
VCTERTPKQAEPEILLKIIDLTRDKIDAILERLQSPEAQLVIHRAMADLDSSETDSLEEDAPKFREWVSNLPLLVTLPRGSDSASLIAHIKWASQARWVYSGQLETMLETQDLTLPSWLKHIYKLGRYYAATKAMIKLAMKQPDILARIHVEVIQPPAPEHFTIRKDPTALATALKRLTKTDPQALMQKLGQNWLTDDPEGRLRKACEMRLLVHAEMQLLSFYDHNVDLTPRLLFMGTSKKACYLCHEFISRHPLTIGVSATHNKLYPAWMPAPGNSAVRKKHKVLLWEFSRHLEGTAARDLEMRLGLRRQPAMDSTAGPSLTTTATDVSGNWVHQVSLRAASAGDQASVADVADVEASLGRGLDAILRLHRS